MSTKAAEEPAPAPARPGFLARTLSAQGARVMGFVRVAGAAATLAAKATKSLLTTRFELRSFIYQLEQLGVKSFGIAAATSIFVGIVMAIQFAFSLERFGAKDSVGRIVGLSMVRELAPSLTSLVVGSRIAAGIAAELGSMAVTEQIDAIRALGADPVKKLVVLGVGSAMVVCRVTFGIPMPFFLSTAIDTVDLADFLSGIGKTPVFGFLVCLLGCYFGMRTRGGTEGVGRSTTTSVVVVSIGILVANAILTQLFLSIIGAA
jgi:phospholipid/cholesterol/gamma-HCH transport system permease protein